VVTDECNYQCVYCPQVKEKNYLTNSAIKKAIDFFSPFFADNGYVNFYGGEPLLAFNQIKQAISYLKQTEQKLDRTFRYSISTNASLIDDDIMHFFDEHKFSIVLSFDGFAQNISRHQNSFDKIVETIVALQKCSNIQLMTYSVFTPETVHLLSKSIQLLMDMLIPDIDFSVSSVLPWDEASLDQLRNQLVAIRQYGLEFYEATNTLPVEFLRETPRSGVSRCDAGQDRMCITPDGMLWGCPVFPNFFQGKEGTSEYKKYCFGDLDMFIANHSRIYPEIVTNYTYLRQDFFRAPQGLCLFCPDLEDCSVCPVYVAFSSSQIGEIPLWLCQIKKVYRQEKKLFLDALHNLNVHQ